MKKLKAILNLSGASTNEVAVKGSTIVSKMTGNAVYPAPSPALSVITTQVTLLNQKVTEQKNALQTYQQKTTEVENERENLMNMLFTEGFYVTTASGGDEAKILSAGYDVRKTATAVGLLPAPKNVLAAEGANDGEIVGTWDKVTGAKSYIVEMSTEIDSPENWYHHLTVTKTKCLITGLASGTRVWIRVAAINGAGQGAYSDPSVKTVP